MAEELVELSFAKVQPTREIESESSYPKWLEKVTERCTLALLCIKDRTDRIQESDWEILRAMHGLWFGGEIILYRTITIPDTRQSTQASLFDSITEENKNVTDSFDDARDKILDGTVLESTPIVTNKKKKK